MATRTLIAAGLLVAALAFPHYAKALHLDFHKDDATAAAARSQLRSQGRNLKQDAGDTICYEGCLAPPVAGPTAVPLPKLLFSSGAPATLQDCYTAALSAGLQYFAVFNVTSCYGGSSYVMGWALEQSCPIDCVPGGPAPGICGGVNKASAFSMGLCLRLDVPCKPDASPLTQPVPPTRPASPSQRPSPPPLSRVPRPPTKPFSGLPEAPEPPTEFPEPPPPAQLPPPPALNCRDNTSLWGVELTKVKLSAKASSANNVATCKAICLEQPACKGFYYKTTQWCYLMSQVLGFKQYGTSVKACRLITGPVP